MGDSTEPPAITVLPEPPPAELLFQAASTEEHVLEDLARRFNTDIDIRNQQGQTALHLALESHDERAAKALVELGANIEMMDFHGRRPLTIAVEENQLNVARILLERGAATEADTDNYNYGHSPLHEAAGLGNLEMVRLMLLYGADVHALSIRERQPLFYAVEGKHSHIVRLLLERNGDPDVRSSDEPSTALHLASENGDIDSMRMLLEGGAQVDPRDFDGATPLFQTVNSGNTEGTKLLLQHGASVRIWRSDGPSVFDLAEGNKEMLELLKADRVLRGPRIRGFEGQGDGGVDSTILKPPPLPAENNKHIMTACMGFNATAIDFFTGGDHEEYIPKTVSVYELLYSHGPGAIRSRLGDREPNFTWYHLPANNMTWAEGLIRRLNAEKGGVSAEVYNEMKIDMELSKQGKKSSKAAVSSLTMRPLCRTVMDGRTFTGIDQEQHVLAFVPFLHFESFNGYRQLAKALKNARTSSPHPRPPPQMLHSVNAGTSRESPTSDSISSVAAQGTTKTPLLHNLKSHLALALSFGEGIWGKLRSKSQDHDPPNQDDVERQISSGSNIRPGSGRESILSRPVIAAPTVRSEHRQWQAEEIRPLQDESRDNADTQANTIPRHGGANTSSRPLSIVNIDGEAPTSPIKSEDRTNHQDATGIQTWALPKRATDRGGKRRVPPPTENLHEYLIKGYFHSDSSSLQPRRTLDQYLYAESETVTNRDEDQVVFRYTRDGTRGEAKIFMVDQLWMWVIGNDTVVTCCPLRWDSWLEKRGPAVPQTGPSRPPLYLKWLSGRVQPPNLPKGIPPAMPGRLQVGQDWVRVANRHSGARPATHKRVLVESDSNDWPELKSPDPLSLSDMIGRYLQRQRRGAVKSVHEFAGLITTCCIDVFDPHEVPDEYMFLDFFDKSIGRANDKAVSYLREFQKALSELSKGVMNPEVMDISNEIELLIEVDDILDELHTLKQVLTDQKAVVQDLNKTLKEVAGDSTPRQYINIRTLENHLSRIDQMRAAAKKADKALHRLMDLKQKQASLSEAHYARESAIDTARQGKTIVVFTVVTIIFLPVSFLAAIFSIDTNGFPRDEDDLIPFDYMLQHILTIGLAISIPLIVVAFNVDQIAKWLNALRDLLGSLFWRLGTVITISVSMFLTILVPVWTSNLDNDVQVAVTVFIMLLTAICGAGYIIWRFVSIATRNLLAASVSSSSSIINDG